MDKATICPLMSEHSIKGNKVECLKEQCALWFGGHQGCAIIVIAMGVTGRIKE